MPGYNEATNGFQGCITPLEVLVRNVIKTVLVALAVLVLCSPLIFWPATRGDTTPTELAQATVTVPPSAVVATTPPPGQTTTTTSLPEEPTSTTTTTTTEPPIDITIAAVGDILPHDSILDSVKQSNGWYDFWPVFAPIAPYLRSADYAIGNLETRFAGADVGYSGYPKMNSPNQLASVLRTAGFDLLGTANNHSMDQGWNGIVKTLDELDTSGIKHVGTYRSAAERAVPLVVNIQGIDVGFLNYTESLNGLTVPSDRQDYAVNMLNVDQVAKDAALARAYGADIVIAMLHYGIEDRRYESDEQQQVSQEILSRGVDVIVGAHSHMVQPINHVLSQSWRLTDTYVAADKYVAYSLGNFLSAQRAPYNDSGVIAYIHITKQNLRTKVTGISYLPVYVQLSTGQTPIRYRILPVLPGSQPSTDTVITPADEQRMSAVWEEQRLLLYNPDEDITPLNPSDLGL